MFFILIVFSLVGWFVQSTLQRKFKAYGQVFLHNGLSGAEIAQKMLRDHGIFDVKITSVEGQLTDHYNPLTKTVNLSADVYQGRSVASAAVAAHEVGHAVQHAQGYAWLQLRSQLVPIVYASNRLMSIVFIAMFLGSFALRLFSFGPIVWIVVAAQAAITFFALVTLPVEYDASARAMKWLTSTGTVTALEEEKAEDALKWAARTYLVAALAAVTQLLYYLSWLNRR